MSTITRDIIKTVQLWTPLSEILVTKSLSSWWDGIHNHRSTTPSAYLAPMPPVGLVDVNWTSDTAVACTSRGVGKAPWSWQAGLTMVAAIVLFYVLPSITRKFSKIWKAVSSGTRGSPSSVQRKEKLAVVIREDGGYGVTPSEYAMLALSPIQGAFDLSAELDSGKKLLKPMGMTIPEDVYTDSTMVARRVLVNLALSGIIFTIDIAPSLPRHREEDAIVEISDLLARW